MQQIEYKHQPGYERIVVQLLVEKCQVQNETNRSLNCFYLSMKTARGPMGHIFGPKIPRTEDLRKAIQLRLLLLEVQTD